MSSAREKKPGRRSSASRRAASSRRESSAGDEPITLSSEAVGSFITICLAGCKSVCIFEDGGAYWLRRSAEVLKAVDGSGQVLFPDNAPSGTGPRSVGPAR
jgi:hypothetical protein